MTEQQQKQHAIQLLKSMYGNADAVIIFFETLTSHLIDPNNMNMKQSQVDPCVFYKFDDSNKLTLIVSIAVDDCAITGTEENIQWFMNRVEKQFKTTRNGELKKYLGVEYSWKKTDKGKMFCDATMTKKANYIVHYYEKYSGTSIKT